MAIVNITVAAYVNPPLYNAIDLAFYSTDQVCYRPKEDYQIDTTTFVAGSKIYKMDNTPAIAGWYSDGHNKGQWNGTALSNYGPCGVDWVASDPYCITDNPSEAVEYSFMRDGSQDNGDCTSFHTPYVEYINESGVASIFYADKCADICGSFMALAITGQHYVINCNDL